MPTPLQLLQSVFGYPEFRGPQAAIIEQIMTGHDALVLMPTGGGKSLCYQIPAILRPGIGVVVSPLIALMQDQVDALLQVGVRAAYLNSSLDRAAVNRIEQQMLAAELDLIYVAPERVLSESFLPLLDRLYQHNHIGLFAIDEAHCVSQWGHDFRPEYIQLSQLCQRYPQVPRIALTATADELTRQEIIQRLGLERAPIFISSFDRPNIRYRVVERHNPRQQLREFLASHPNQAGIVYCLSRKKVDDTAEWLNQQGFKALPYHAGLDARTRQTNQSRFLRDDAIIMVATIAFGMGIDKPDVRFVAHLDLPKSLEAYYQETGRAGRDGEAAEVWMVYGLNDVLIHRQRIDESNASAEQKRIERSKLDALLAWCETLCCRRVRLLAYFAEGSQACGNCDTCLEPPQEFDGTIAAQKALSAALRTGQRFGAGHLIDLLRGKTTDKMTQLGHVNLPTFGVGQEFDDAGWRSVFRQLLAAGLLQTEAHGFGALRLTALARPVLKGEVKLALRQYQAKKRSRTDKLTRISANTSDSDSSLFTNLRLWRAETARAQGIAAFMILHDRCLHELAAQRPQNTEQLLLISGIGQTKAERYGAELLQLLS